MEEVNDQDKNEDEDEDESVIEENEDENADDEDKDENVDEEENDGNLFPREMPVQPLARGTDCTGETIARFLMHCLMHIALPSTLDCTGLHWIAH